MSRRYQYDFGKLLSKHSETEDYIQRLEAVHWKQVLLHRRDVVVFQGRHRQLIAKNIGFGLVEISKQPLPAPEEKQ